MGTIDMVTRSFDPQRAPMPTYKEFHRRSLADRDSFWREQAALIDWQTPFTQVLDYSRPPFAKWFVGGHTNLCHNAIDRHLAARGEQHAVTYISTETGATARYTYRELHAEVNRCAAVLQSLGVGRGDRVLIYMPMIPEAMFAMLACARIGAVHSVVFGGFAAASLATRIDDARPKVLFTADAGMRGGKAVPYKHLVDEAMRLCRHAAGIGGHRRPRHRPRLPRRGRAATSTTRRLRAQHMDAQVPCAWLESSEPSYILYTSGTTGKPKGVQRDTGGYAVALAASMRHIFDVAPGETMFTTSDIGWVVGHSYIIYAPLHQWLHDDPVRRPADPPRSGHLVEDRRRRERHDDVQFAHRDSRAEEAGPGVHAPARRLAIALPVPGRRAAGRAHRALGVRCAGRCRDRRQLLADRIRVADSVRACRVSRTRRASSAARRFRSTATTSGCCTKAPAPKSRPNEKGVLMIMPPLPPGCMSTVWGDDDRFVKTYFSTFPDKLAYSTFDWATRDDDGYYFVLGRTDDVINVAGHRLGTREIEEAVQAHAGIAEVAVVGMADPLKGQIPVAFAVVKDPAQIADAAGMAQMRKEVHGHGRSRTGRHRRGRAPCYFVTVLPKTRSGKLLRRSLQALAEGRDPGDLTTIEDPGALEQIKAALATKA